MRFAEQLSDALLTYSQTGDTRTLLQAQKHLLSTEDENGDTCVQLCEFLVICDEKLTMWV